MSGALREHFLASRRPLVVTGTHGKTTTSAMCAHVLSTAKREPGYFIGGIPKDLGKGAAIGRAKRNLAGPASEPTPFVVEGDEYDAVYWKKEPKFFDYVGAAPNDVVIATSLEHDHVDIYPDEASYEAAFAGMIGRIGQGSGGGLLVVDASSAPLLRLADRAPCRVVTYGLDTDRDRVTPTWLAAVGAIDDAGRQTFDAFVGGSSLGRFALSSAAPGLHNVRNALGALAACSDGFGVRPGEARAAFQTFSGVKRRQDLVAEEDGVAVYDDFAHHPTAVDETLRALKRKHPRARLWAIFEPRSATACRSMHQAAYAHAFDAADHAIIAPLGRSNVPEAERLDVAALAAALGDKGETLAVDDIVRRVTDVATGARPGDVVAILSNGAFGGIHGKSAAGLRSRGGGGAR